MAVGVIERHYADCVWCKWYGFPSRDECFVYWLQMLPVPPLTSMFVVHWALQKVLFPRVAEAVGIREGMKPFLGIWTRGEAGQFHPRCRLSRDGLVGVLEYSGGGSGQGYLLWLDGPRVASLVVEACIQAERMCPCDPGSADRGRRLPVGYIDLGRLVAVWMAQESDLWPNVYLQPRESFADPFLVLVEACGEAGVELSVSEDIYPAHVPVVSSPVEYLVLVACGSTLLQGRHLGRSPEREFEARLGRVVLWEVSRMAGDELSALWRGVVPRGARTLSEVVEHVIREFSIRLLV